MISWEEFLQQWQVKDPDDILNELRISSQELCSKFEDELYLLYLQEVKESEDELL